LINIPYKESILKRVKDIETMINKFFATFTEEQDGLLEKLFDAVTELRGELSLCQKES